MQLIYNFLNGIGAAGLILTMLLEGLSVPFPGIIVIFTLGYILNLSLIQIVLIAAAMSLTYSIASCVPYSIGFKLENIIRKKYEKQINAVQRYFSKYGNFSIALLRPFAVGNYVSYIAGMSRVKLWKYILFTFIGIYPWSFAMLFVGKFTKGNIATALESTQSYMGYVYIPIAIVLLFYICGIVVHRLKYKAKAMK